MAAGNQIGQLLNQTLSFDGEVVRKATLQLDSLSLSSDFPFSLLSLLTGDGNQGQKVAAATYLKNLIRRNLYGEGQSVAFTKEFKDRLLESLLRAELPVLKLLVEAFRLVVDAEFVKNSWPELIHELRYAIQNSNIISANVNSGWLILNALKALQAVIKPFQYFLNPKITKESVPQQLEQIANEILVPLLTVFHTFAEQAIATTGSLNIETERFLLIVCKCIYFSVKSYMPSSLVPLLLSFCHDLCGILGSLNLEKSVSSEDTVQVRIKTGKRILLIFCSLVSRHRKYSDKLMPDIMKSVQRIARCSTNICNLDSSSERVVSLAFDVISHVLETGPGWRLVSPHFSSLLDSAIFPALMINTKDMSEWEEDADEFINKNLPSDLEEISGWRDDLFTARKSAINLLGVISMSKGPPVATKGAASLLKRKKDEKKKGKERYSVGELLVLPFLTKFPIPSDANAFDSSIINSYFGVLMGYGALQDFLREKNPEYTASLIRIRVLPLYNVSIALPYLIAAANWILGELASCLPEDMIEEVYSALLKALAMPDCADASCYQVRACAAGAIVKLLDNDYLPLDWLPLLQVIVSRIDNEEEEISILFQLLCSVVETGAKDVAVHAPIIVTQLVSAFSKHIPSNREPWPQAVIHGFAALAVIAKSWQDTVPDEDEESQSSEKWSSDQAIIARAFSALLQQAWLVPTETMDQDVDDDDDGSPPPSCIDDASTLLWFILRSITGNDFLLELKVSDLLGVWGGLISDWHGWEELEDLPIFDCIPEIINLQNTIGLRNFFTTKMPLPPAPPVPKQSLIECIGAFICDAIPQYMSATSRACTCIHVLLHLLHYSSETEDAKQSLVFAFSETAFTRFREIQSKPCPLWKTLLLAISSCYLCYPEIVENVLEKGEKGGFVVWASTLNSITSGSFTPDTLTESEAKLVVITLAKVVEQLASKEGTAIGMIPECFSSLLAAFIRLKEVHEENGEEETEETGDEEDEEDTDDDDDEDSDDDDDEVHEETEEEFLKRYAEAAAALENGTVVEDGDAEEYDEDIEIGILKHLDEQEILGSLLTRFHHILVQKQSPSSQLVSTFLSSFPEYSVFFQ